jgi:RsiW-degrading membrane proteinase PrsW (M82 family)
MKRISSLKLALILGFTIEVIFVLLMALGRYGPCGPDSSLGLLLTLFHYPGAVLASPICGDSNPSHASISLIIGMLVMWGTSALILTALLYIPVRVLRWLGRKHDDA